MPTQDYIQSIYAWRSQLDGDLRREFSWLTSLGLTWLKEGVNTLGSSPDCDVRLPRYAPRLLGAIELHGSTAMLSADIGQSVDVNGFSVRAATPLHAEGDGPPASMISARHRANRVADLRIRPRKWRAYRLCVKANKTSRSLISKTPSVWKTV